MFCIFSIIKCLLLSNWKPQNHAKSILGTDSSAWTILTAVPVLILWSCTNWLPHAVTVYWCLMMKDPHDNINNVKIRRDLWECLHKNVALAIKQVHDCRHKNRALNSRFFMFLKSKTLSLSLSHTHTHIHTHIHTHTHTHTHTCVYIHTPPPPSNTNSRKFQQVHFSSPHCANCQSSL